ncbi:MAG TPA: type II restriction endonuclease, partial [Caldithrix sp.]|nr:type II restriction endonuclease [Caldithrix sp.]
SLDDLCKITQGTKPFQVGKGNPKQTREIVNTKPYVSETKIDDSFIPLLRGSLMNRYVINWQNNYWIKFGDWLAEPRYSAKYDSEEKIIIRQTGDSLVATLDNKQFIVRDNLYTIVLKKEKLNLKYILGLINSKLTNWYYQNILNPEKGEALAQVKKGHLAKLPIKIADEETQNEIIALVDKALKLKSADSKADISAQQTEIDKLVYQLYDLTPEEIEMVEKQWFNVLLMSVKH